MYSGRAGARARAHTRCAYIKSVCMCALDFVYSDTLAALLLLWSEWVRERSRAPVRSLFGTADCVLCGCFRCVSEFVFSSVSNCGSDCVCTYISLSISSCEYLRVYCMHKTYKFIAYEFCHLLLSLSLSVFFLHFVFGEQSPISVFFPIVLAVAPAFAISVFAFIVFDCPILAHFDYDAFCMQSCQTRKQNR